MSRPDHPVLILSCGNKRSLKKWTDLWSGRSSLRLIVLPTEILSALQWHIRIRFSMLTVFSLTSVDCVFVVLTFSSNSAVASWASVSGGEGRVQLCPVMWASPSAPFDVSWRSLMLKRQSLAGAEPETCTDLEERTRKRRLQVWSSFGCEDNGYIWNENRIRVKCAITDLLQVMLIEFHWRFPLTYRLAILKIHAWKLSRALIPVSSVGSITIKHPLFVPLCQV